MVEEYNKFITCDDAERVALDTFHYRDGAVGESSEEMPKRSSPLARSQKDSAHKLRGGTRYSAKYLSPQGGAVYLQRECAARGSE